VQIEFFLSHTYHSVISRVVLHIYLHSFNIIYNLHVMVKSAYLSTTLMDTISVYIYPPLYYNNYTILFITQVSLISFHSFLSNFIFNNPSFIYLFSDLYSLLQSGIYKFRLHRHISIGILNVLLTTNV